MLIIGGDQQPVEYMRLPAVDDDKTEYYAKPAISASIAPADFRLGETITLPEIVTDPDDARGLWIINISYDANFVFIDYAGRTVTPLQQGATQITFSVENADGSIIPVVWDLLIRQKLTPLTVQMQPQGDLSIMFGMPLELIATAAGGDAPYKYTFIHNGKTVQSGVSDTYYRDMLDWNEEGVYTVMVTDAQGRAATSSTAHLDIYPEPIIIPGLPGQDRIITLDVGAPLDIYAVAVGGRPPLSFKWFRDGTLVGTTQRLVLNNPQMGDYTFSVTDSLGSSGTVAFKYSVSILTERMILRPVDAAAIAATSGEYVIKMDHTPLLYQAVGVRIGDSTNTPIPGYGNGATLSGLDPDVVTFDNTGLPADQFRLIPKKPGIIANGMLQNAGGTARGAHIAISVISTPVFTTQPTLPPLLINGATTTLTVALADMDYNARVQWQRKAAGATTFTNINGAAALMYKIPAVSAANNGDVYRVVATNNYGQRISNETTLAVASFNGLTAAVPGILVPGGVYTVTASAFSNTALQESGTAVTWNLTSNPHVTLTPVTGNKLQARLTVDDDAPAITTPLVITVTAANANGDTPVTANATANVTVSHPVPAPQADPVVVNNSAETRVPFPVGAEFPRDASFNVAGSITPTIAIISWDENKRELVITAAATGTGSATVSLQYTAPGGKRMTLTSSLNIQSTFVVVPKLTETTLTGVMQGTTYKLKWSDPTSIIGVNAVSSNNNTVYAVTDATTHETTLIFKNVFSSSTNPITVDVYFAYTDADGNNWLGTDKLTIRSIVATTRKFSLTGSPFTTTVGGSVTVTLVGFDPATDELVGLNAMAGSISPASRSFDNTTGTMTLTFNKTGSYRGQILLGAKGVGINGAWFKSPNVTGTVS